MLKIKFKKNEEILEERLRLVMRNDIDPEYLDHAEHLENNTERGSLEFLEMRGDTAYFRIESSSKPGKYFQMAVRFDEFSEIMNDPELSTARKKAFALVKGPMSSFRVHCTCPSYRYHYQYVATNKGDAIAPQKTPAVIRNPANRGAMCKHLDLLTDVLPFNAMRFVKAIKAQMG